MFRPFKSPGPLEYSKQNGGYLSIRELETGLLEKDYCPTLNELLPAYAALLWSLSFHLVNIDN